MARAAHLAAIKRVATSLAHAGVTDATGADARCVVLTNILSLLFCAASAFFVVAMALIGIEAVAIFCVFLCIALLPWIYCNHRGWHLSARVGLIVAANLGGLGMCLMLGAESRMPTCYVCLIGVTVLLFEGRSVRNDWLVACGAALSVLCYFVAEYLPIPALRVEALTATHMAQVQLASMPVYFGVVFFEIYYLQRVNALVTREKNQAHTTLIASAKLAALGEMAGSIAHEINTPLAVIKMRATHIRRILAREPVDAVTAAKFTGVVEDTVDRIATIVQGLRAFCRNGEGDAAELVDARQVVQDALALCAERLHHSGVSLQLSLPQEPLLIRCRAVQMSQVVLNLVSNAYDAISAREDKWIRLSVEEREKVVELRVVDCGAGIPAKIREKIFHPFFTTKEIGKGTGLGLSISKGLVEDQGGALMLDDAAPNTCFVVRLPSVGPAPAVQPIAPLQQAV